MARNLADRDREFAFNSSSFAVTGFLVKMVAIPSWTLSLKKFLTILSSREWKEMTANLPPEARTDSASGNAVFNDSNSPFTAIRNAWNDLAPMWALAHIESPR